MKFDFVMHRLHPSDQLLCKADSVHGGEEGRVLKVLTALDTYQKNIPTPFALSPFKA